MPEKKMKYNFFWCNLTPNPNPPKQPLPLKDAPPQKKTNKTTKNKKQNKKPKKKPETKNKNNIKNKTNNPPPHFF